jgi:WhiB family redox-sensing transcriptional regulator
MQLTALIDLKHQAGRAHADIPCQEYDAALWFAESPADVELAKTLCGPCPARADCLAGALDP